MKDDELHTLDDVCTRTYDLPHMTAKKCGSCGKQGLERKLNCRNAFVFLALQSIRS